MTDDLFSRSEKMLKTEEPFKLTGMMRSIHFLRGVFSRSTLCIPAFYYLLGSSSSHIKGEEAETYSFKVAQSYFSFSSLNTISLSCRKVFDHGKKPDLTGANFGKLSDQVLDEHAEYWSKRANRTKDECIRALIFLRTVFTKYSKNSNQLLKSNGYLHKRVGLLKQHADRSAAHLSLEDYSLDILDIAHFTGAIAIIGEIVRSFDNPWLGDKYFNEIDLAAFEGAKKIFPHIEEFKLFGHMKVHQQARYYWKYYQEELIQSYFDGLSSALG